RREHVCLQTLLRSELYTLSLHDALPICRIVTKSGLRVVSARRITQIATGGKTAPTFCYRLRSRRHTQMHISFACSVRYALSMPRSEEHTSELQSRVDLVCRLLLEKKK